MEDKNEIKRKLFKAYQTVSAEEWALAANLSAEEVAQLEDMFKAVCKLKPSIEESAHAIVKCCAQTALSFCTCNEKYKIGYSGKYINKAILFLTSLIQELKMDFEEQIAAQDKVP